MRVDACHPKQNSKDRGKTTTIPSGQPELATLSDQSQKKKKEKKKSKYMKF